jgi:hypothetical protein
MAACSGSSAAVAVSPTTSSAAASPAASPTGGEAAPCGPFDHPIDDLPTPQPGETQVAEGSGCGVGHIPANGTFTVGTSSNWILRFAYTCSGQFNGMGDPAVVFSAHNTVSGAELSPVIQPGPWGYGAGGVTGDLSGASPPIGTYLVLVSVAHPDLHQCQWRAAVGWS